MKISLASLSREFDIKTKDSSGGGGYHNKQYAFSKSHDALGVIHYTFYFSRDFKSLSRPKSFATITELRDYMTKYFAGSPKVKMAMQEIAILEWAEMLAKWRLDNPYISC